jgi:hypothetical protein
MSTAVAGVQRSPHRRTGTDWDTDWDTDGAKCDPDRMIAHPARYFDRLPCDTDASCAAHDGARPRAGGLRDRREGVIRVLRTLRDMYVSALSALFV